MSLLNLVWLLVYDVLIELGHNTLFKNFMKNEKFIILGWCQHDIEVSGWLPLLILMHTKLLWVIIFNRIHSFCLHSLKLINIDVS